MAANAKEFSIEVTAVPREHVQDVLRALLHSIFFHRLLLNIAPRERRLLDNTVATTDLQQVNDLIEERVAEFYQSTNHLKQGKIAVLFYEKRLKKNWFQLLNSDELVCWERWIITLQLIHPQSEQERQKARRALVKQLSRCLMDILKTANDYKEHIPSITITEGNPFPYHIAIPAQSESWGAMIKRLLVTDAPPETQQQQRRVVPTPSSSSSSSKTQPRNF